MPDLSDDDINRSDDQVMDYSVHIHMPDIVGGRRTSHITTFYEEDCHEDPKKSSTPKTEGQQTTGPSTSGDPSTTAAKPIHKKRTPPSTSPNQPKVSKVITVVADPEKNHAQEESKDLQVAFIHSEISCVRENIKKMDKLPDEVKLLPNSIDSVHGNVNTVGANCVKVKTDVTSILEEVRDTDKVVHDVKTHVLGLHTEANNLKGDIHVLKSKTVELKVVSQGAKDEVGDVRMLKEDITSVEGKINILQQDMPHIKHEIGLMKSDVSTVTQGATEQRTKFLEY